MILVTGDFNSKHNRWYSEDTTDKYGTTIQEMFAHHTLIQTVDQPTNITSQTKHCINLVATDQPNLISKNVFPSLHTTCSHQLNLIKLDLKCPPPPPYIRTVYHYARANVSSLKTSLTQFDWAHHLNSFDDPLKQVEFFYLTLLNVANNFIPHNEKLFVPRDSPWLTKALQNYIKRRNTQRHGKQSTNLPT